MDRELNLPLTAKESAYVKMALQRMKTNIDAYIALAREQRITIDNLQWQRDIAVIENILEKIERMADG